MLVARPEETAARPPLDERTQGLITEGRFIEAYREDIRELFHVLGKDELWSDPPSAEMLAYIRSSWIGAEHGNTGNKEQFTDEQFGAAMPIFVRMGLVHETLPPDGAHFDDAIIVGGTTQANYRRGAVVRDAIAQHGVTTDRITVWAGQRPREARDGTNEELLEPTGRFAGADVRDDPWVRMLEGRLEEGDPWEFTETESAHLMMMKLFGHLALQAANVELGNAEGPHTSLPTHQDGVPPREVESYELETEGGQKILIMNAAAVDRGDGRPPRHTTASCAREWLQHHAPPHGARVLFVSSNPHTLRTAQDTYAVLEEMGRGDIELVVAGASAPSNATIQLFLGEVGRLIDNDVSHNRHAPAPEQSSDVAEAELPIDSAEHVIEDTLRALRSLRPDDMGRDAQWRLWLWGRQSANFRFLTVQDREGHHTAHVGLVVQRNGEPALMIQRLGNPPETQTVTGAEEIAASLRRIGISADTALPELLQVIQRRSPDLPGLPGLIDRAEHIEATTKGEAWGEGGIVVRTVRKASRGRIVSEERRI